MLGSGRITFVIGTKERWHQLKQDANLHPTRVLRVSVPQHVMPYQANQAPSFHYRVTGFKEGTAFAARRIVLIAMHWTR